jgi:AraC-like DNA-binding protein
VRFQAATQQKLTGVRDLTEIAYACGYYDQSHFIKDFRQFSGYTPKEYFWDTVEGTQYMDS